jgi:hypothetical protein
MGALGFLFNGKKIAFFLEIGRLFITIPFFVFLLGGIELTNPIFIGGMAWLLISLFWILPTYSVLKNDIEEPRLEKIDVSLD